MLRGRTICVSGGPNRERFTRNDGGDISQARVLEVLQDAGFQTAGPHCTRQANTILIPDSAQQASRTQLGNAATNAEVLKWSDFVGLLNDRSEAYRTLDEAGLVIGGEDLRPRRTKAVPTRRLTKQQTARPPRPRAQPRSNLSSRLRAIARELIREADEYDQQTRADATW